MKKLLALSVMAVVAGSAFANPAVIIQSKSFGSGTPGAVGGTKATSSLPDGLYYAPQYLPGFPTAATIWPRVIDVNCKTVGADVSCDGYEWMPDLGRGEYLYIRPHAPAPIKVIPVIKKKKAE